MMNQNDRQDRREEASVTAFLSLLGALDAGERDAFDARRRDGDPDAVSAAREAEEITLALATAVPERTPSPNLRQRLFDVIGKESAPTFAAERAAWLKSFLAKATDLAWEAFAPGVRVKWLFRDEAKREYVALLKAVAGSRYPAHRHVGVEEVLMLDGRLRLDDREYVDGEFVRAEAGSTHHHTEAMEECTFIIHSSFDTDLL
jgi:quercetin dioxygenase-like cupin family protein